MSRSVIVAGARTPIGKLSGAFASLSAQDLGGVAIRATLERAGLAPELVDAVLMGQVIQAGQGQITARQAAVKGGIPMSVNATTINKVCLSGLQTIYMADLMIRAGEADIVLPPETMLPAAGHRRRAGGLAAPAGRLVLGDHLSGRVFQHNALVIARVELRRHSQLHQRLIALLLRQGQGQRLCVIGVLDP